MLDITTQSLLRDVTVRVCRLTDIACDKPVTPLLTPNSDGWVDVPLTQNFTGYLEVQSPGEVPYVFQLSGTLRTRCEFPVVMISAHASPGAATVPPASTRPRRSSIGHARGNDNC